ncbi:MAG: NYN domain-containing protein [Patescibacteria group bacterium]
MTAIKHPGQRVGIFIDTQNLYHSAKNIYKRRVNFGQIVKDGLAGRTLVRALAYMVRTESGEEQSFIEALEKAGIETKTKDLQIFYGGAKKADWDVGIAVDAITLSSRLDAVIIVSGDGDFIPLVEYLQFNKGCQVEVIAFGKSASAKLIEAADDYINLDDNSRRYLMPGSNYRERPNTREA